MAAAQIYIPGWMPAFARNGDTCVARLYFYADGTTDPKPVYTSSALTTKHPFPIVSDDAGRFRSGRIPERLGDHPQRQIVALLGKLALRLDDGGLRQPLDRAGKAGCVGETGLVIAPPQRYGAAGGIDDVEERVDHAFARGNQQDIELAGNGGVEIGRFDGADGGGRDDRAAETACHDGRRLTLRGKACIGRYTNGSQHGMLLS